MQLFWGQKLLLLNKADVSAVRLMYLLMLQQPHQRADNRAVNEQGKLLHS